MDDQWAGESSDAEVECTDGVAPEQYAESVVAPTSIKVRRGRLSGFMAAQVAAGTLGAALLVMTGWQEPCTTSALFLGVVFGQTGLLGVWGGLGEGRWYVRFAGFVCGVGYLVLLLGIGIDVGPRNVFFPVVLAGVMVACAALALRYRGFRLSPRGAALASRPQYSIRDMLILTFAAACLISLGQWLQPTLPFESLVPILLIDGGVAVVAVAAVWLVLGMERRMLPNIVLVFIGAGIGIGIAQHAELTSDPLVWRVVLTADALFVGASLNVLRVWGYRLVRRRSVLPAERSA